MQTAVAEAVARSTREQAVTDARRDLQELRRRAVEAGRDRSRKIIKTSRIDTRTGEIRYNPAGRLLRDWYLHVYMNTLRANLGEPAVTIDAQQVEETTALLHRVRGSSAPLDALRAVGVVRDVAVDDAAQAAADVVTHAAVVVSRRAVLHAADDRFAGDQLAIQITRHWFQRCYEDHVHGATRSRQPLTEVTDAEERQVALSLESGQALRLIDQGGRPLVTAHGTVVTNFDRNLAVGMTGLVSAAIDVARHTDPTEPLRERVTRTWRDLDLQARAMWLRTSGADPASAEMPWTHLGSAEQTSLIRLYLQTHTPAQIGVPFEGQPIDAEPRSAAMTMFGHAKPLDTVEGTVRGREQDSSNLVRAAADPMRSQELAREDPPSAAVKAIGLG
jgi:hypothetical protein